MMKETMRVTHCDRCGTKVQAKWWQSDRDRGDRGWVRACQHGDYVPSGSVQEVEVVR